MRHFFTCVLLFLNALYMFSQEASSFCFLGIPVDGPRPEFIAKLKHKGFTYDSTNNCLSGVFNGIDSNILVTDNNGKVDRVVVIGAHAVDVNQIRLQYNLLLKQFKDKNDKYLDLTLSESANLPIPEGEDIGFQMTHNKKTYSAHFSFNPTYDWSDEQRSLFYQSVVHEFKEKYGEKKPDDISDEDWDFTLKMVAFDRIRKLVSGKVWFTIYGVPPSYYIFLFYDNLNNRPNGEDL